MTVEEILASMQAIIDTADGRSLTDDEVQRYEDLEGELKATERTAELRSRQRAYITPAPGVTTAAAPAGADDVLERAFDHYLRTGLANQDIVELRAQSEGTPSEGGYLVPDGFREKLVDRMKAYGGLAPHVENFVTATGNPVEWPTADDTANVGELVAEGATIASGDDIVFGTATLGAYSYSTGGASNLPLKVSRELMQDSAFNIQDHISKQFAKRLGRITSTQIITGTGTGQPQGIVYGTTPTQPAANTGWTYADLVTFVHAVDPDYRKNAKWAFNDQTLAAIRKLTDGSNRPLWQPGDSGLVGDMPGGTLLGYPVVIDQGFPDLDIDDSTDHCGVFGDLSEAYVLRRVKDFEMIVFNELYAANRQIGFMAWMRMDGTVQNANAYVTLSGKS